MQKRRQKISNKSKRKKEEKKTKNNSAIKSNNYSLQYRDQEQVDQISKLLSLNCMNKKFQNNKKIFQKDSYLNKVNELKNKLLKKNASENNTKKKLKKSKSQKHKKQKTLTKTFTTQNLLDQFSEYSTETQKISENSFVFLQPQKKSKQIKEKKNTNQKEKDDFRLKYLLEKCRQFKLLDEENKRRDNMIREQSKTINIIFQKKSDKEKNSNEQLFEENLDSFVNKISEEQFIQTLQTFEFSKHYFTSTIFQDQEFLLGFLEQIFQLIVQDQKLKKHLKTDIFKDFTIQEYNFEPILSLDLFWKVIQQFDKEYAEEKFFQYYCKMLFDSLNQELDIKRFEYFYKCQTYNYQYNIKKKYFTFGSVYQGIIDKMIKYDQHKIQYDNIDYDVVQDQILNEIIEEKDIFQIQLYEANDTKEYLSKFLFEYLMQDLVLNFLQQIINLYNLMPKLFYFFCKQNDIQFYTKVSYIDIFMGSLIALLLSKEILQINYLLDKEYQYFIQLFKVVFSIAAFAQFKNQKTYYTILHKMYMTCRIFCSFIFTYMICQSILQYLLDKRSRKQVSFSQNVSKHFLFILYQIVDCYWSYCIAKIL